MTENGLLQPNPAVRSSVKRTGSVPAAGAERKANGSGR
jgi:hypothetical protein